MSIGSQQEVRAPSRRPRLPTKTAPTDSVAASTVRRGAGRLAASRAARLAPLAGVLLGLVALPTGASAALVEPPPLPHIFTVFPDRDFVSVEGYDPGENLTASGSCATA